MSVVGIGYHEIIRRTRLWLIALAAIMIVFGSLPGRADQPALQIIGVANHNAATPTAPLSLNDYLEIKLNAAGTANATDYVLFLNGYRIDGLSNTVYNDASNALIIRLERNATNKDAWTDLLGSPGLAAKTVSVALGVKTPATPDPGPTIRGDTAAHSQINLMALPPISFGIAVVAVILVCVLVWGGAVRTTILKDNLLPQVAPTQQPYSLGRWQMAFWFTLIFASFVFLFALLGDPNSLNEQALMLMGISGATGLASVAVDIAKDTPTDAANAALRAIGINTYADVLRVQQEIADRQTRLQADPPPEDAAVLMSQIDDRQMLLRTYQNTIKPYVSEGWFRDLTTDLNGPALHRMQVFCWTWVLGVIFVVGVYGELAMPAFSATLLAVMGISGAGYVGFKYPESQQ